MSSERDFDLVLWGATGFTGRLVAQYLFETYGGDSFRWALAGRSTRRLEEVRGAIGAGEEVPIVRATLDDLSELARMVRRTRVICTTVGPYARYGTDLLAACAREGTHYCDLTGEVQWMRRMIDAYQDEASRNGARIVHSCGFDCIPSDLGTWFVQQTMRERHGVSSPYVKCRVAGFRGGTSGGTAASMLNLLEEASQKPEVRRVLAHPYALNPKDARSGPDPPDSLRPFWDEGFDQWVGPFMMAGVDTRVVRRSNALLDYRYGRGFRYDEGILCGPGRSGLLRASLTAAGLGGITAAGGIGALRSLLRFGMPSPGKGPSAKQRESGFWHLRFLAVHPSDPETLLRARVTGDRDPGYGSTSKMLGEAAVCLAQDELASDPGLLTPAAAMGEALVARLREKAGVAFELE